MKKVFVLVIALCFALCLCGCEELEKLENIELPPLPTAMPEQTPQPTAEPQPTPAPTETPTPADTKIIVNTALTSLEEFDPAEGTELILSYSYETPIVFMEERSEAAANINSAIALLDETHYTGNDHGMGNGTGGFNMMLEMAQDNFAYVYNTGAQGVSLEYTASRTASIARADSRLLSIVYNDYYYTGGEQGKSFIRGYCFDTVSGAKLSIDELFTDPEALRGDLAGQMAAMAQSDAEISAKIDPALVSADTFAGLLRDGSWYLDREGLKIVSDPGEMSSEDKGPIYFAIAYEQLKGKLDEQWLPAERSGGAKLSLAYLSDLEAGSVEIFDRVAVHEQGEELCLLVEGTAWDVKLSTVEYTDRFFETAHHWYASSLSDCALQIAALIPEGIPNLMLSYSDAGGESHRLLISQSGEDGSLQLVADDIEAVG